MDAAPDARPYEPRVEDVLVLLAQVPERIGDVLGGLDADRLRHRHAPALPTLGELLEHLIASGRAFDGVMRGVLGGRVEDLDVEAALHPPGAGEAAAADTEDLPSRLDDFARDRRRTAEQLRGLEPARWSDEVSDRALGPVSMLDLVKRAVHHETAHMTQLRNLLALLPEPRDLGPVR